MLNLKTLEWEWFCHRVPSFVCTLHCTVHCKLDSLEYLYIGCKDGNVHSRDLIPPIGGIRSLLCTDAEGKWSVIKMTIKIIFTRF